jgi:hypothetical protein
MADIEDNGFFAIGLMLLRIPSRSVMRSDYRVMLTAEEPPEETFFVALVHWH